MTFDELKQINDEIRNAEVKARHIQQAAYDIGEIRRKGKAATIDAVNPPIKSAYAHLQNVSDIAVRKALLDLLPDILRLAEMRLDAQHRELIALARARRLQLAGYLGGGDDSE